MNRVQLLLIGLLLITGIGCSESLLTNPEDGQYELNSALSTTSFIEVEDEWADAYKIDFNDRTEYGRRIKIQGLLREVDKSESLSESPIYEYFVFGVGSPNWGRVSGRGLMDGDVMHLVDPSLPTLNFANPEELEQSIVEISFSENVEKFRLAVRQHSIWYIKPPSLSAYNAAGEEIDMDAHSGQNLIELLQVSDPEGSIRKVTLSITNRYTMLDNIEILFAPADPKSQIMDITGSIDDMIGSNLNAGTASALTQKLQSAISSLEQDNPTAAINKMDAFKNQINGMIRSKKITELSGKELLETVTAIQELIREA